MPGVAAATAIWPESVARASEGAADVWRVLGDDGGGEASGGDGAVARDDAPADRAAEAEAEAEADDAAVGEAAETAAGQTPAGDVGAIGLPAEGTYRNPSASPSCRTRLEIPTLESRHDPPPLDTKTAQ
jgi:hypothetical protein